MLMRVCFFLTCVFFFGACSGGSESKPSLDTDTVISTDSAENTPDPAGESDEETEIISEEGQETDTLALDSDDLAFPDEDGDAVSTLPCTILFGTPNEKTGLSSEQCQPVCNCEGKFFAPPVYTEEDIAALLALVPVNPPAEVTENPYDKPDEHQPTPGAVCGLIRDDALFNGYRLETFVSEAAAVAADAYLTHWDACGVCSTIADLVVYMRYPDLTDPVRQCGINNIGNKDGNIACLRDLGFTLPCAQIWYYNTQNTQKECFSVCMAALNKPYHNPDGSLNECLICDEEKSGPVFKAVAGRTRRNTGLPSSMCRPCTEVQPVVHRYW